MAFIMYTLGLVLFGEVPSWSLRVIITCIVVFGLLLLNSSFKAEASSDLLIRFVFYWADFCSFSCSYSLQFNPDLLLTKKHYILFA